MADYGLGPGWNPVPAGNDRNGNPLVTLTLPSGQRITVNASEAPRFAGWAGTLGGAGAPFGNIGSYNDRNIDPRYTGGRAVPSQHAFGNAIDVGSQSGRDEVSPEFRSWYNKNQPLVRAADEEYGIKSGADFSRPDLGHFELQPNRPSPTQVADAQQRIAALAPTPAPQRVASLPPPPQTPAVASLPPLGAPAVSAQPAPQLASPSGTIPYTAPPAPPPAPPPVNLTPPTATQSQPSTTPPPPLNIAPPATAEAPPVAPTGADAIAAQETGMGGLGNIGSLGKLAQSVLSQGNSIQPAPVPQAPMAPQANLGVGTGLAAQMASLMRQGQQPQQQYDPRYTQALINAINGQEPV